MKRFSEMSAEELSAEIEQLAERMRRSESEGERDVLKQRWLLARSYAVRENAFPPGPYRIEDRDERFTLRYVNGVMGWGTAENGEERAYPLAVLRSENSNP
ncbi:DUF1811 family protein [Paenibacillus sp.]|uniref:DUF1811 family protein n=1 Tax=Paenibacillus sp. TaxID=58172 RepID=UPI002D6A7620|nr:DUF1811 family protein [Paenibacillus sp.]HZG56658.1 DUF1811 family protein [Paenibacillus sp.]